MSNPELYDIARRIADEYRAAPTELVAELIDDQTEWPDGHPCRDCGQLYRDHLPNDPDCEGWR